MVEGDDEVAFEIADLCEYPLGNLEGVVSGSDIANHLAVLGVICADGALAVFRGVNDNFGLSPAAERPAEWPIEDRY